MREVVRGWANIPSFTQSAMIDSDFTNSVTEKYLPKIGVWALIGFVAAVMVFREHYRFQEDDQTIHLLHAYYNHDPDFCRGDWFTEKTKTVHPTYTFLAEFLLRFHSIETGFFVLYCLNLSVLAIALKLLCDTLFHKRIVFLWLILLLVFYRHIGLNEYPVYRHVLLPNDMAIPAALFSILYLLRKRFISAGIMMGIAGIIHVNFGVAGIIFLSLYAVIRFKRVGWKNAILLLLTCSVTFAPVFIPLFISTWGAAHTPSESFETMFVLRAPHIYDPTTFDWKSAVMLVSLGGGGFWFYRKNIYAHHLAIILGALIAMFMIAFVFTAALPVPFIQALTLWRFYQLFLVLCLALCAFAVDQIFRMPSIYLRMGNAFVLATLFMNLDYAALAGFSGLVFCRVFNAKEFESFEKYNSMILFVTGACFALGIFAQALLKPLTLYRFVAALGIVSLFFLVDRLRRENLTRIRAGTVLLTISVVAMLHYSGAETLQRPKLWPKPPDPEYAQLSQWVRENTDPGSLFLIPPDMEGFRLGTGRGIFINFKGDPVTGVELIQWKERLLELSGVNRFPDNAGGFDLAGWLGRRYGQLAPAHLRFLASKYRLDYILFRKTQPNFDTAQEVGWRLVYENRDFAVFPKP